MATLKSPRFVANARLQKAANNSPAMCKGEFGQGVRLLQQALADLGFPLPISIKAGNPDGWYGDETAKMVKAFQAQRNLTADGIAGKNTWAWLDYLLPAPATPLPPNPAPTHRVRLHLRTVASPIIPEFTMLDAAVAVYGQYGIRLEMASGQSLGLDPKVAVKVATVDTECQWDADTGDQDELFGQGTSQGVGATDVLVYYVNKIQDTTTSKPLFGCAGHKPSRAAVIVSSTGSKWTMAHELGHVLLGSKFLPVHSTDSTNIMMAPTTSINAQLPAFTDTQLEQVRKSRFVLPA